MARVLRPPAESQYYRKIRWSQIKCVDPVAFFYGCRYLPDCSNGLEQCFGAGTHLGMNIILHCFILLSRLSVSFSLSLGVNFCIGTGT